MWWRVKTDDCSPVLMFNITSHILLLQTINNFAFYFHQKPNWTEYIIRWLINCFLLLWVDWKQSRWRHLEILRRVKTMSWQTNLKLHNPGSVDMCNTLWQLDLQPLSFTRRENSILHYLASYIPVVIPVRCSLHLSEHVCLFFEHEGQSTGTVLIHTANSVPHLCMQRLNFSLASAVFAWMTVNNKNDDKMMIDFIVCACINFCYLKENIKFI